jgi:hypothetical protein
MVDGTELADRPAHRDEKIEITSEMISRGAEIILSGICGPAMCLSLAAELSEQVILAALSAPHDKIS